MSRNHYQPSKDEYSRFVITELVKQIASDPIANEWVELMTKQVAAQNQGIRDFGQIGAYELIIASLVKGVFIPKDEYMRDFMAQFHTKERG